MKAMNYWLISCAHAAELIDKRHTVGLSVTDGIRLKIHSRICVVCLRYSKQQKWIDDALKLMRDKEPNPDRVEAVKKRILEAVGNA